MKNIAPQLRRSLLLQVLIIVSLTPGLVIMPVPLRANPHGQQVVAGNVNFQGLGSANLNINNLSQKAIINWQSFSIQQGEVTRINQAGNAITLNRVVSGNPTEIYGQLKAANGGVVVVNPNGIVVGQGGAIDVAGMLTMSTLDVSNRDFLNGGQDRFRGTTAAGVRNYGTIESQNGDVVLMGNFLQNAGEVNAPRGVVAFGAGGDMVVDHAGGATISVKSGGAGSDVGIDNSGTVNAAAAQLAAHGNVYALAIKNDGVVRASGYNFKGGKLTLSGGSNGRIVNNGTLQARNSDGSGGEVMISGGQVEINAGSVDASGAPGQVGGNVSISGSGVNVAAGATVTAVGSTGGRVSIASTGITSLNGNVAASGSSAAGGRVTVEGSDVTIGSQAIVDVSGETGGGTAMIGGGFQGRDAELTNAENLTVESGSLIIADAVGSGKGGNIILWADGDTLFDGDISATGINGGGFAEISGKSTLEMSVTSKVDLTSVSGAAGTLLLDPTDITITATGAPGIGGSTISNVWISSQLDAGTNVVISTNIGGTQAGNITVGRLDSSANAAADQIEWYQDSASIVGGTLSLLAMGDIRFNSSVHSAGQGGVNVVAGWDGTSGLSMGGFDMAAVLATMNDGNTANDAAGLYNTVNGSYGSVFLGGTGTQAGVDVGSRWGNTNLAARDLFLRGSILRGQSYAQLGFMDNGVEYELSRTHNGLVLNEWWGNTAGNVQSKNYIALLGGTEFGTGDTLTLGDRAFRGAGWGATGDINVGLSGRYDARGGLNSSYTQVGHGGMLADGTENKWLTGQAARTTRDGIQISVTQNRFSVFASTWRTNYAGNAARIDGDITLKADGDILLMGSRDFDVNDDQSVSVNQDIYSLIGHGGVENHSSTHGDITVIANGQTPAGFLRGPQGLGIQLIGGRGTRSFVQIGHGTSYEGNSQSVWDQSSSGNIVVTATTGAIRLLGHNQAIRNGDINAGPLIEGTTATPINNSSDSSNLASHVQIGHGGATSAFPGAGGTFIMPGGTNVNTIIPDNSMTGDITVFAGGTFVDPRNPGANVGIQVKAGNRRWYHAMIGHGGTNLRAENLADQTPNFGGGATTPFGSPALAASRGFQGNIRVEADKGDVVVAGGDNFRADRVWGYGFNFGQIGHGGDVVRGPKGGTITVLAGQGVGATGGDIRFSAGKMYRDHAMLGHGGLDSDSTLIGGWDSGTDTATLGANTAEIKVTARGGISFFSGESGDRDALSLSTDYSYWWFSNANPTGAPQTAQPGYWQTEDRFVQLGHGGYASTTIIPDKQDITVISGTGDMANADGNVNTGGITFTSGDMERSYAQLGHGGHSVGNNDALGFTGDITVTANGGGLKFDGSILGGQGLTRTTGVSLNGSSTTTVVRGFGAGFEAYVQLGHGGYGARGVHTGDITINTWGGVDFLAALASPAVSRVGNTSIIQSAIATGNGVWIPIAQLQDNAYPVSSLLDYQMPEAYSDIVPGSVRIELSDGRFIVDVPRNSSDDRTSAPTAGTPAVFVPQPTAGLFLNGAKVGEINYTTGLISFREGGITAAASTGTGIDPVPIPVVIGAATVVATTYQSVQGNKERAYAQLGHGGFEADGPNNKANNLPSMSGDITIGAAGDIRFQGGAAHRSYAQLGHGGLDVKGIKSGNITIDKVDATHLVGGLRFTAGNGGYRQWDYQNYTQLGHGGFDSDGNMFGNITIKGTQDSQGVGLLFKAGEYQDAYAQLGHGGANTRSGTGDGALSFGMNGDIDIEVGGQVAFVAGTMRVTNPLYDDDGRLYAMLGHGGYNADPSNNDTTNLTAINTSGLPAGTVGAGDGNWGHFGDIRLVTTSGDISFMGGSNIPLATRVDFDGIPLGISDPLGLLTGLGQGRGRTNWAQLGHGGILTGGSHFGDITVSTESGSVNVIGGMFSTDLTVTKFNYSQIGHGSAEAPGNTGKVGEAIKVYALGGTGDVKVIGGDAGRTGAQIGNGGYNSSGNSDAFIKIIASNNVVVNSGVGLNLDNWGKIGNGDQRNLGTGTRNGDIEISAGNSLRTGQAIIGHFDFEIAPSEVLRSNQGDTFIAVGRNNPYAGGPGLFITTDRTVITSAGGGIFGDLRLYMPDSSSNRIAAGTYLNNANYTRTPAPGTNRADEQIAVEHIFPATGLTEADASFTPEGSYPAHPFGLYNIYYGGVDPFVPPVVPPVTPPVVPPVVPPIPGFGPFFYGPTYDSYYRGDELFSYDGYDEALYSIAYEDAIEDESDASAGGWLLEDLVDGDIGSDDERDEELDRRKEFADRKVGRGGLTFYVFDPGTNRYSSYRVFGVAQGELSVTQ